ncbi:dehydrogenase/reductase SDR family member 2, mitochondrial-like [Eubalaena glacialis]|uniref:dehydrogenase/reductase SDR family member 2, mitochondrial-like n=1 Tax=Eubalaena glacialis TaxID=27606 RepID=UPI002A5AFC77|nr:dehydrogenase/reductase SDR family member 2, mitochondrial-like [Eubalaena glacialis]
MAASLLESASLPGAPDSAVTPAHVTAAMMAEEAEPRGPPPSRLPCTSSLPLLEETSSGANSRKTLVNQVTVITGSTVVIGFTISRHLAQDVAHVVVSSQKQQNVGLVVAALKGVGLNVMGTVCHVGKGEDREQLVAMVLEHCRGVDFLVCVPGINPLTESTVGSSEQVWDKILDVNVKSSTLLWSQLLPHMQNRGHSGHESPEDGDPETPQSP